jgi:hypothetical protein
LSRLWLPASAASPGRRVCGWRAGEEPLIRLVDSRAVSGGEQVQEKATDHGHAEPGVGPGRPFVGPGFDQGGGDRGDPRFDDAVEESLGAGAAAQGVGVQLEEQPLLRPQLGIAEALPGLPGVVCGGCPRLQQGGPLLVFYCLGNRDQQPWARRRMRSAVPRRGRSVRSG